MSLVAHEQDFSPWELVVDSAPGTSTLASAVAAFTADVKNPVIKFILSIFLGIIYCALAIKAWVLGREPMLHELRRWLGDENVIGKKTKREENNKFKPADLPRFRTVADTILPGRLIRRTAPFGGAYVGANPAPAANSRSVVK